MLKIECETSITWNLEEANAILWTCQPVMLRKMAKMGIKPMRDDGEGKAFYIPKGWVKVNYRKPRILTDEQRKAISDRFKKAIKSKP